MNIKIIIYLALLTSRVGRLVGEEGNKGKEGSSNGNKAE